jgi:DNA-binding CsgD family transcriptional regulator
VFRRLSVFAGGFTLDAAEAVVAGEPVDAVEVLGVLLALVDKSFVVAADETGRYSLLETLRQYGSARLFEAVETEVVRDRHLDWAAGLFDTVRLRATGYLGFMPFANDEIENLRAAFEWAITTANADAACVLASTIMWWEGDLGDAAEAVRVGLRAIELPERQLRLHLLVCAALIWANYEVGDYGRSATMYDVVQQHLPELDPDDVMVRTTCLRMMSFSVRHHTFTSSVLDDTLAAAELAADPAVVALCESMLAMRAAWRGDLATALELSARVPSDADTVAGRNALSSRAASALTAGRFEEARRLLDELAAIFLGGLPRLVVYIEAQRVYVDLAQGVDSGAAARIAGLLEDARRRRFLSGVASAGWAPGGWALGHGDVDTALTELLAWRGEEHNMRLLGRLWFGLFVQALLAHGRFEDAEAELVRVSDRELPADLRLHQSAARTVALRGVVARARNDLVPAERWTHEALARQHEMGWRPDVVHSLETLAGIAAANESYPESARLAGAAQRMRDEMGYVLRWPYEQKLLDSDLAAARAALGDDAFDAAWGEGLALDEAAAVAYAQRARGERKRPSVGWESLTPVEGEVVRLVAEGLTNKQVGDALFIGAETVKTHLSHVYDKLGVRSRTALAAQFAERAESPTPT